MQTCRKCGSVFTDRATDCPKCGALVREEAQREPLSSDTGERTKVSLASKFWLGIAFPLLLFVLFILFIVFAIRLGQGFAPAFVFVLSVYAVPVMLLVNCWVLFVDWRSRGRLFAAGLAMPLCVGFIMVIIIHAK